jgi:dipeptidyl aminopeptidase/acylaminoacyl peptidase
VLAVPQSATSQASNTVRLYQRDPFNSQRAVRPLYRPFTTTDGQLAVPGIDLSADGRWLSYNDGRFRVHLVNLTTDSDRVLGAGLGPRFSPDGRYLAYVAVPGKPLPGLGPFGDGVMIYDLRAGTLRRTGQPRGALVSSVVWSPRGGRLAWQVLLNRPTAPFTIGVADAAQPARLRTITPAAHMPISGGVTWGADGRGLLFWGLAAMGGTAQNQLPRFALLGQPLAGGPVRVVLPAMAVDWIEGIPPPPVLSPDGRLIASLIGDRRGFNQLVLFRRGGAVARRVPLPGEPRQVAFAPTGPQVAVAWNVYRNNADMRHVTLVNAASGRTQDLGPAVAAFWLSTESQ